MDGPPKPQDAHASCRLQPLRAHTMVNSPMRSGGGGASGRHASSGQHYSLSRIAAVVLGFALLIALVYVFEHQHDALQAANANAASSLITMGARGAARGSMRWGASRVCTPARALLLQCSPSALA